MTQDEIIETAVQAGMYREVLTLGRNVELLTAFAKLVSQHEREACAKAILAIANDDAGNPYKQAMRIGAEAIRGRGQA